METIEVEIFTDQGNGAVLRLPHRKFPGLLLQGDTLGNLVAMAESVEQLSASGSVALQEDASALAESLRELRHWYELAIK
ncbi:hypothetical protein GCM10007862_25610 [Dyella lipolytica]|uniref:Uncharacterized protein n=1 Tax=Dyella lipolytica TaxID=1867835 RepID=A0ABW8ISF6_9GAMM|nr:hypothetical protein [Dyella lipolytica]GLQ47510.1 hypothetical protein GCM10007862_25610 [Dyella lipolytica]